MSERFSEISSPLDFPLSEEICLLGLALQAASPNGDVASKELKSRLKASIAHMYIKYDGACSGCNTACTIRRGIFRLGPEGMVLDEACEDPTLQYESHAIDIGKGQKRGHSYDVLSWRE